MFVFSSQATNVLDLKHGKVLEKERILRSFANERVGDQMMTKDPESTVIVLKSELFSDN